MLSNIPSYVINLDKDSAKWQKIEPHLYSKGLNPIRFPGYLGHNVSVQDKFISSANSLSLGQIGATYSHIKLWTEAFSDSEVDNILIFEDDAFTYLTPHDLNQKVEQAFEQLGQKIDILYLGKCFDRCGSYIEQSDNLYQSFEPHCAHSYILTRQGYHKLQQRLPFSTVIDIELAHAAKDKTVNSFVFHPSLFTQDVVSFDSGVSSKKQAYNNIVECMDFLDLKNEENHQLAGLLLFVILLLIIIILVIIYHQTK